MIELKVSEINDLKSFQSLKLEWNTLLRKSKSGSFFLTWDWLHTWWCKFHRDRVLNIITIRDHHGVLVGIGPFCINKKWGRLPVKALSFLGTSPISSEYLDIIVDPDHEEVISAVIFDQLYSSVEAWDCLILTDMLDTSCINKYFKKFSLSKSFTVKKTLSSVCPYLELEVSREAMSGKFKPQLQSTIKRRAKKLEKLGVELRVVGNARELAININKLFELHQKCWNARGVKGNFSDDLIKSFHVEVSQHLLPSDFLRLYTLEIDGYTIAALYAFQFKRTLFYFQSGFDPEWSSYSPGTVLMWKCIGDAIDLGLTEFDYLRGSEFYKNLWTDQYRNTYTMAFIPPGSIKVNICFLLIDLKRVLKLIVKNLCAVIKLKK